MSVWFACHHTFIYLPSEISESRIERTDLGLLTPQHAALTPRSGLGWHIYGHPVHTHCRWRAASCHFGLNKPQSTRDLKSLEVSLAEGTTGGRRLHGEGRVKIKWQADCRALCMPSYEDQENKENQSNASTSPRVRGWPPPWTCYLRLSVSSVKPFPFKLGWKEQKLDKKGKDYSVSRVRTLPPPGEYFWKQARDQVHSCPSNELHLSLDLGVPLRHPISTLFH